MRSILHLLAASILFGLASSSAVILPRDPRGSSGGGGGGGGRGGGGGGSGRTGSGRTGSGGGGSGGGAGTGGSRSGSGSSGSTYHSGNTFSSGTGRGGSGDTGSSPISYYRLGSTNRNANFFGGGGGSRFTLGGASIFKGRESGGGHRNEIVGTRSYGSGYPYTSRDSRTYGVVGQPFPFGFWPLYWYGWGHSSEYGGNTTVEWQRPGNSQAMVQISPDPTSTWGNNTLGVNHTLWMIGDRDSLSALFTLLKDPKEYYTYGCDVEDSSIVTMDSNRAPRNIQFDNIIQWYRSSSFALAFDGYNNTYAVAPLNQTAGLGWVDSTPLPASLVSSPFLQCINTTIVAALPIIDQEPPYKMATPVIVGIILGSCAFLIISYCLIRLCMDRVGRKSKKPKESKKSLKGSAVHVQHTPLATEDSPGIPPIFRFPEPSQAGDDKFATSEKQSLLAFPEPSAGSYSSPHCDLGVGGSRRGSMDSAHTLTAPPIYGHGQDRSSDATVESAIHVQSTLVVKS